MKKGIILLLAVMLFIPAASLSAYEGFGIGIIAGEPTGISLKKSLGDKTAVDAAVAWSFLDNASFQVHADYLIHNHTLVDSGDASGKIPVYFGVGGRLKLKDDSGSDGRNESDSLIGVRVPLGISYLFTEYPIDVFAEIVPILDLFPATHFGINAAIGARYYFR